MNKIISSFFFLCLWHSSFAQIEFDTLVYSEGTCKVYVVYETNYLMHDYSALDYIYINSDKGSDIYDSKSGQFRELDVGFHNLAITSDKLTGKKVEGHFLSFKKGLYGIIDSVGNTIIPPIYKEIRTGDSYDHFIGMGNKDSLFIINLNKEIISLGTQYKKYSTYITNHNRITTKTEEEEHVVLDFEGKVLMRSFDYKLTTAGNTNYVFAQSKDNFFGPFVLMNFAGDTIIQPKRKYENVYADDQLIMFYDDNKFSEVYDYDLKPIEFSEFTIIGKGWSADFYEIRGPKGKGLLNRKFEVALAPAYKSCFPITRDKMFSAKNKEGEVIYNWNGEKISPAGYRDINWVRGSDYFIVNHGRWGVVNRSNDTIIPIEQKDVRGMMVPLRYTSNKRHTFFGVMQSQELTDLYNEKGDLLCNGCFTRFMEPRGSDGNRLFLIRGKKEVLLFNNEGEQVAPKVFAGIYPRLDDEPSRYLVVKNQEQKYGVIDNNGNEVMPLLYDNILNVNDSLFVIQDEKGAGYFRIKE